VIAPSKNTPTAQSLLSPPTPKMIAPWGGGGGASERRLREAAAGGEKDLLAHGLIATGAGACEEALGEQGEGGGGRGQRKGRLVVFTRIQRFEASGLGGVCRFDGEAIRGSCTGAVG
jgi:hypothetical protein